MTLKIGDFVWFDKCVAEIEERDFANFRGHSLGCASDDYRGGFGYQSWYISSNAPKVQVKHLEHIKQAIEDNHIALQDPEVKEFINKLSKWLIINIVKG